ncbi:MAG: glycosyltransferase family 9 protein [Bauldia litoralis]
MTGVAEPAPRRAGGPGEPRRILVIRLGALGDFTQSLGPMAAIRKHHPGARIALLTTPPFAPLARACGVVDTIWTDGRPRRFGWAWWRLIRRLRRARFDRVYDLQTSARTASYWRWLGRPDWSGHVPGCSLPDPDPDRNTKHTIDRQRGQLAAAGIAAVPVTDLAPVTADITRFGLDGPYVLLVPGGSAHRPAKRWPAARYAILARRLTWSGLTPVLIGGPDEVPLAQAIVARTAEVRDLTGQTSFAEIVALARLATGAVGNDTGPMHLIAMAGCPSLALFSNESDPSLCAPRPGASGGRVIVLRRPSLDTLSVDEVEAGLPFAVVR